VLPARIGSTGSGAFAALCIVLLTAGLIALLLLNTALAQGSLALGQLQRDSARLTDTASNLQEEIDAASASGSLARRATQLGMVRMSERAYIDLATGTVTGEAKAATKDLAVPIVTSPTPLAVTSKVKGVLSSATSVATKAQTSAQKAAAAAKAATAGQAAAGTTPTATPTANATPSAPGAAATPGATPTLGTSAGPSAPPAQPTKPAPTTAR
jgi:hypothetical protein